MTPEEAEARRSLAWLIRSAKDKDTLDGFARLVGSALRFGIIARDGYDELVRHGAAQREVIG